jgi:hypothetical protein
LTTRSKKHVLRFGVCDHVLLLLLLSFNLLLALLLQSTFAI